MIATVCAICAVEDILKGKVLFECDGKSALTKIVLGGAITKMEEKEFSTEMVTTTWS